MQILVREVASGVCNYVWKKVNTVNPITFNYHECNYHAENKTYNCLDVLKIKHDYRKGDYVICGNCGKVVNKSKLVAHYEEQERNANCLKCDNLTLRKDKSVKSVLKMLPNGKVQEKSINNPYCGNGYYSSVSIEEVNKLQRCKYYACRRASEREIPSDFHATYPNPFNNILTEAGIINKKWTFNGSEYNNTRRYSNKNGKVIAVFDTNGLLMYFMLLYRDDSFRFVYSDVYDKFFGVNGREFGWGGLADTTIERYKKQIRALY